MHEAMHAALLRERRGRGRMEGSTAPVVTRFVDDSDDGDEDESAASERDVAREGRRIANRDRQRAKRARDKILEENERFYSDDELCAMDAMDAFVIPSAERCAEIQARLLEDFGAGSWESCPCGVCECSVPLSTAVKHLVNEAFVKKLRRCLLPESTATIPEFIQKQYDVSSLCEGLAGVLLYPPAFHREGEAVSVSLCKTCSVHVKRGSKKPPGLAIANGNWIGWLPCDLPALSRTDEMAVALVCPCVDLATVTGGACKMIRSHHYVVRNTEGPIVEMLPRDLSSKVRIAVVGPMTPTQEAACRRRYDVNVEGCRDVLRFLVSSNPLYQRRRSDIVLDGVGAVNVNWTSVPTSVDGVGDVSSYGTSGSEPRGSASADESAWAGQTSLLMSQAGSSDFCVRRSNAYARGRRWSECVEMFPTLFPSGCGGPSEPRVTRLSVKRWVQRCLLLDKGRFAVHYGFLLLAFDYLALEHARQSLFFKFNVKKTALLAGTVSAAVVGASVNYHRACSEAVRVGRTLPPVPDGIEGILNVRRGLNLCESAYYGSNQERAQARHELFGYVKRFGPLQIFFTISPDSGGTYTIGEICGEVSTEAIAEAQLALLPSRAQRRSIAANHPVTCAEYFLRVIDCTIEHVLGWDQQRQRPKRGGGLFGVVRSYACATETQQAGDLHAHFVVWLHGFPPSGRALRERLESDDVYKERALSLVDGVVSTAIPASIGPSRCCSCGCNFTSVLPPIEGYRSPKPGATAVVTSNCVACGKVNCDRDLINASIEAASAMFGFEVSVEHADFYVCKHPTRLECAEDRLELTLVMREVQVHFWTHTGSCFKITKRIPKGSVCRFFRPAEVNEAQTFIDENSDVIPHRMVGSEYVNPYNSVILNTFKCNHDVRFVLGCGSKNVVSYVCKYCMKPQNSIENETAFAVAAFGRGQTSLQRREDAASMTASERGFKVISSMLYSLTNKQEVSAPLAALYVIRESPFWFSFEPVRVNFGAIFDSLDDDQDEDVTATEVEDITINVSRASNSVRKYWRRPTSLETVPFQSFAEEWDERSVSALDGGVSYTKRERRKVLIVMGQQIPDLATELKPCEREFYYRSLLTLFKCHRSAEELLCSNSFEDSYSAFMASSDPATRSQVTAYEATVQDFYMAAHEETQDVSEEETLLNSRGACADTYTHDVGSDVDETELSELVGAPLDSEEGPEEDGFPDADSSRLAKAKAIMDSQCNVLATVNAVAALGTTPSGNTLVEPPDMTDYTSRLCTNLPLDSGVDGAGTSEFLRAYPVFTTRLEKFEDCFRPVRWDSACGLEMDVVSLPAFPSIAQVSAAYNLNFWQHSAFDMMARHLLYGYLQDCAECSEDMVPFASQRPYEIKQQLRGFLGGEAGTGKSTVIHAVLTYAQKWRRPETVETLAFTGVASFGISGRTIHSARNLTLQGRPKKTSPSHGMRERYQCVRLVIVDEISMISQSLLGALDQTSRALTDAPDEVMGGNHFVLCGDWLQLPPVGGAKCFTVPAQTDPESKHSGYNMYQSLNFVVFLTQNMRSRLDAQYTSLVRRARWGNLLPEDIDALNSRVASESSIPQSPGFRPFVVATNDLRGAINLQMTLATASASGIELYECCAVSSKVRSREILHNIRNVNDELTDRIPIRLIFFVGMPIMLTKKHPDLKAANIVANGTIGEIVGFTTGTPVDSSHFVDGYRVGLFEELPRMIFVKVRGCDQTLVRGYPAGVIGIPPMTVQIGLRKIPNLAACSVTVKQFPIVPAFACTTEKLQGQTCGEGVIVTALQRHNCAVPPQTLYVALSRTTALQKLHLTRPFTDDYLARFRPQADVVQEMRRLQAMVVCPPNTPSDEAAAFQEWMHSEAES